MTLRDMNDKDPLIAAVLFLLSTCGSADGTAEVLGQNIRKDYDLSPPREPIVILPSPPDELDLTRARRELVTAPDPS